MEWFERFNKIGFLLPSPVSLISNSGCDSGDSVNMPVSPLDYRYGREEAKEIWSREGRHSRQLEVERALVWAHCKMGRVSAEHYDMVADISDPGIVTADRVEEIEAETKHDIMALTKAMAEAAGEVFVKFLQTSY